eukprot:TRINITY_DN7091_c0_g1_i1.p1 TRINITY_DN7091_c0_g1~~TRINITY_DN7091_c0_g1_i1.p1  ORF type:complete len:257 (-),score=60.88 TRINITY_DN7091_c0_g1_i1:936-1706(-)
MCVSQIKRAFVSKNIFEIGFAAAFASSICNEEIVEYVKEDVGRLLLHSKTFVRKRACVLAKKVILLSLDSSQQIAKLLINTLKDESISVLVSATTAILSCIATCPHLFAEAIPLLYDLLEKKDSWLKIKAIQALSALLDSEKRLYAKLTRKFLLLLKTNKALSVELEVYKQVVRHFEGFGELGRSVQEKIESYMAHSDPNIRYMGVTLAKNFLRHNRPMIMMYKKRLVSMISCGDMPIAVRALETVSRYVIRLYDH